MTETMTEQTVTLTVTEHTMLVQTVENLERELAQARETERRLRRQLALTVAALPERDEAEAAENGLL